MAPRVRVRPMRVVGEQDGRQRRLGTLRVPRLRHHLGRGLPLPRHARLVPAVQGPLASRVQILLAHERVRDPLRRGRVDGAVGAAHATGVRDGVHHVIGQPPPMACDGVHGQVDRP